MGKFVKDPDRLRPCAGTCGRMTRNSKMLAKDFPDSVVRANAEKCNACLKEERIANGTYVEPVSNAKSVAAKEREAAERLALAEKARLALVEQRRARARRRVPARAGLGQSMVRI